MAAGFPKEVTKLLQIDGQRLNQTLKKLGEIGWVEGEGLQRPAYTEAYFEAQAFLRREMESAGLQTRVDSVGNLFGVLPGESGKKILTGSHLDSVYNGGIYDGPLGIAAGLEALRSMKEQGYVPKHTMEVAAFIAEEGEPLGGTFGSRAFAGMIAPGYKNDTLKRFGLSDDDVAASKAERSDYAAFLELHIEQGPYLERKGLPLGIPSGIVGIARYNVVIEGAANHAGTTPMRERSDAMRAAADLIHEWYLYMDLQNDLVCNVGVLDIVPAHVSVVPEKVTFCLELRSLSEEKLKEAADEMQTLIADMPRCKGHMESLGAKAPVALDGEIVKLLSSICEAKQWPAEIMPSGASHDAAAIAKVIPTGMIFVPSKNGVSHSKEEYTSPEEIAHGGELLLAALLELDRR